MLRQIKRLHTLKAQGFVPILLIVVGAVIALASAMLYKQIIQKNKINPLKVSPVATSTVSIATSTQQKVSEVDISKWKTYRANNAVFTFEYPSHWSTHDALSGIVLNDQSGIATVVLNTADSTRLGMSLLCITPNHCEEYNQWAVNWNFDGKAQAERSYASGTRVFVSLNVVNESNKTIFKHILSTFKFIK